METEYPLLHFLRDLMLVDMRHCETGCDADRFHQVWECGFFFLALCVCCGFCVCVRTWFFNFNCGCSTSPKTEMSLVTNYRNETHV